MKGTTIDWFSVRVSQCSVDLMFYCEKCKEYNQVDETIELDNTDGYNNTEHRLYICIGCDYIHFSTYEYMDMNRIYYEIIDSIKGTGPTALGLISMVTIE